MADKRAAYYLVYFERHYAWRGKSHQCLIDDIEICQSELGGTLSARGFCSLENESVKPSKCSYAFVQSKIQGYVVEKSFPSPCT